MYKTSKLINVFIKNSQDNLAQLVFELVTLAMRFGVPVLLYGYVFALLGGSLRGLGYEAAVWSMFFYFVLLSLRLRELPRSIEADVRSGKVEVYITKPINYLFFKAVEQLGVGFPSFITTLFVGGSALWLYAGFPFVDFNSIYAVSIVGTFLLSVCLSLYVYVLVGMVAFYMEDISSVFRIIDKVNMVLGGAFVPVYLFPAVVQKVALYSPFGASFFLTHVTYPYWQDRWVTMLGIQAAYILLFALIIFFMYKKILKNISINGG